MWLVAVAVVLSALLVGAEARADARTDYLVRALNSSPMFRVRAQAAISLGGVRTEPQVIEALSQALRDEHATVRAAAASALERHGDPSAIPALQRAASDREPAVRAAVTRAVTALSRIARTQPRSTGIPAGAGASGRSGPVRFYVAVGRPATSIRSVPRSVLDHAQELLERAARDIPGVEIAPAGERPAAARGVLRQRSLVGFYIDSSIVSVEPRPGGALRASVSVVLQSYPDRNIRSMMTGAATVTGASGPQAQQQAIEGAFRGALRNLAQAMAAAGP